jgi:hypothetical protein
MLDDDTLRRQVRAAIQAGNLPQRLPGRVWAGPATMGRCTVCGEPTGDGVEFELIFSDDWRGADKSCCLHPRCMEAFEREVEGLPERAAPRAARAANDGVGADVRHGQAGGG